MVFTHNLEAGKDFRQGSDWIIFCILRIFMAVLWGMDWREERREAERWLWVVIMDQVRDAYGPNCVQSVGPEISVWVLVT